MSGSASARRLGIPVSTFNENRRAGVIGGGGNTRGSSRSERDSRDREAPLGRATHDVAGRVLAMTGQMEEARPTFGEPAHGVAGGGVLAGLPMLLREGLLSAASRLLGLPNGFYGVASVLLFVAFLALARLRNAKSLRYPAPGEWAILLGLDRCPEVKTLRRKIRLMAGRDGAVHAWEDALAQQGDRRAQGDPQQPSHPYPCRRPARKRGAPHAAGRGASAPRHHPNDRLPRRNPHDAAPHHRARQGPERQETPPRLAHIRCRCHPRTRSRNPARPVPRSRQRCLRAEPGSPHRRTQSNPHQVSRHRSHHGCKFFRA